MTLAKREIHNTKTRTINIGGDEIKIIHVGFEVSEKNWTKMHDMMKDKYDNEKIKSHVMRVMVNAVALGIVNIEELEKQIEKKAEKLDEVIYI